MKPIRYIDILHRKGWAYKSSAKTDVGATIAAALRAQRRPDPPANVMALKKKPAS